MGRFPLCDGVIDHATHALGSHPVSKVRVFGDAAVVTGRQFAKHVIRGQELDAQESFTEVYVKEAGKWRCALIQLSRNVPLPEKKP